MFYLKQKRKKVYLRESNELAKKEIVLVNNFTLVREEDLNR